VGGDRLWSPSTRWIGKVRTLIGYIYFVLLQTASSRQLQCTRESESQSIEIDTHSTNKQSPQPASHRFIEARVRTGPGFGSHRRCCLIAFKKGEQLEGALLLLLLLLLRLLLLLLCVCVWWIRLSHPISAALTDPPAP
jgi:hypothetical protein